MILLPSLNDADTVPQKEHSDMEEKDKYEMMAVALQQRIGELVMMYEGQIASLRAEMTALLNEKQKSGDQN